jgi:hypothetical protein
MVFGTELTARYEDRIPCCSYSCVRGSAQPIYKRRTPVVTHNQSRPLHLIIILSEEDAADERAVYTFSVSVPMYSLDKVGVGVTRSPDGERDETTFPAYPRECEFAGLLVSNPI